jgi:glycosyltransferase involved in cell wall biosynthesis
MLSADTRLNEDSIMQTIARLGLPAKPAPSKDEVTVVIPSLNESEAIVAVIKELRQLGYHKILVVDGYSVDGTPELAAKCGAQVISQLGTGKTGAIATAIDRVQTPYMLVMDADYTYDPSCIERLLAHASEYDEVIGARRSGVHNIPALNRFGNAGLSWMFRVLFGVSIRDICSGMYLLRTRAARKLQLTTGGFDVEAEISSQIASHGRIAEVPINYRARLGRRKMSGIRSGVTIATSIVRLANTYNPVLLYSSLLTLSAIPAASILGWVVYERLVRNIWHSGVALFGVMLLLVATQSFSVATMSLLIKRSEHRIYQTLEDIAGRAIAEP